MKKKNLITYWDNYYDNIKNFKESSFAKFTSKYFGRKQNNKKIIDIGCGNGRDSIYFYKQKLSVVGIDISKRAIKKNLSYSNPKLKFINLDIEKKTMSGKFNFIYSRFFLHAINEKTEDKLLKLINKLKKKNTLLFLEYRNHKDLIFKNIKNKKHNQVIEFEKGHFRRIIYTDKLIKKISKSFKGKIIYKKSAKNLSIVKKDNPNLSRIIYKF
tara:strand:- start:1477 stop:2115 length:639 start_codon:yes stop_codon:yes gene_type:complete